jgi:hypothetical protein
MSGSNTNHGFVLILRRGSLMYILLFVMPFVSAWVMGRGHFGDVV